MQDHLPHLRQRPAHREPSYRDIGDGGDQQEDLVLHPSLVPERLVAQSKGLSKMSLYTLMKSATILPREKYTLKLIQAIILKQVTIFCIKKYNYFLLYVQTPKIAGNLFKGELNFSR